MRAFSLWVPAAGKDMSNYWPFTRVFPWDGCPVELPPRCVQPGPNIEEYMKLLLVDSLTQGIIFLGATPSPGPGDNGLRPGLSADQVTPGLLGFVMTAFMVIAVVALMVSMTRRIRRVRYRAQVGEGDAGGLAAPDVRSVQVPEDPARQG